MKRPNGFTAVPDLREKMLDRDAHPLSSGADAKRWRRCLPSSGTSGSWGQLPATTWGNPANLQNLVRNDQIVVDSGEELLLLRLF